MIQKIIFLIALSVASAVLFATFKTGNPIYHDDAFITLTYARNLLSGNGLAFNPGEYVWGFTSPLHVITLSILGLAFNDLPSVDLIIGVTSCALYPLVLFYLLRRFTSDLMAFIICLLTISSPYNFQFLGLETNLLILSQMGLLYVSLFGNPLIAGLLAAITCLIRPDSIVFAIPILLLSKRLINLRVALAFIIPGILWEGFSLAYFSDWLPQTFHAKKGLSNINDFLVMALPGISKITFISQEHAPYLWASLNLITTLGCLANKRIRNSLPLVYALLIYPWVLIAAYALIGTPPGHSWEYRSAMVFNTSALMLGFFQILELSSNKFISLFIRERPSIQKILQYTLVFGVLLLVANNTQNHIQRIQSEKTEYWWGGRHHTYLMVADWLRENITDKDKVHYGEPGTIAYFSGHFITDNFLISHVGLEGVNYLIKQGDITNWDEAGQSFYRVKFFDKDGFEPISILRKKL